MRLSGLAIAAILLISVSVPAQRGGGGTSSGAGHSGGSSGASSHGGSSVGSPGSPRGSVSSSSGYSSSGRSNSSSARSGRSSSERSSLDRSSSERAERSPKDPAGTGLNIRPNLLKSPVSEKLEEKPEKKGVFSFLHHKKPEPPNTFLFQCKKGQSCAIPVRAACSTGRVWNSSSCAQYDQYAWFNACRTLADQLAMERERMRFGGAPGESFRYQMVLNQYRQCVSRFGAAPFAAYLFNDPSFFPYF